MYRHVILTGNPGVGKTTIIKETVNALKGYDITVGGFYTEEVRNEFNKRIGFDVVTTNGNRSILSRKGCVLNSQERMKNKGKVGDYVVLIDNFEKCVIPVFEEKSNVLVLDEIGKMELLSTKYKQAIVNSFKQTDRFILATIPAKKGSVDKIVEDIRTDPNCKILTVEKSNRGALLKEVIEMMTAYVSDKNSS